MMIEIVRNSNSVRKTRLSGGEGEDEEEGDIRNGISTNGLEASVPWEYFVIIPSTRLFLHQLSPLRCSFGRDQSSTFDNLVLACQLLPWYLCHAVRSPLRIQDKQFRRICPPTSSETLSEACAQRGGHGRKVENTLGELAITNPGAWDGRATWFLAH
jgi:hypothetical protein